MKRILEILIVAGGLAVAAYAQAPTVTAVLDAGEYSNNVAQGSVFVVKGTNLSGSGYTPAPSLPLGTTLAGVKITFTRLGGGTGFDAYMVYTYNLSGVNQLAALLPSSVPAGDYNVTVTNGSATSANFRTTVVGRKFRIITVDGSGSGNAVMQEFISETRYDLNRFTSGTLPGTTITHSPARGQQVVVIWGTGMGGVTVADNAAPGLIDFRTQANISVLVDGQAIRPDIYAGRAPSLPGTDEIIVTLPANVATGCTVSLQVSVDGQLSNPTTIAIAPAGADACVSSTFSRDVLTRLDQGGSLTTGSFALTSFATSMTMEGLGTINAKIESANGAFSRYTGGQLASATAFQSQPGACQVYRRTGNQTAILFGGSATNLDAGSAITLAGPNVVASNSQLKRDASNSYALDLGTSISGLPFPIPGFNANPIVAAGTYTLTGTGGAGVGAFRASVAVGQPVTIPPPGLPATVNRGQGLTVSWTGGGATDIVNVVGASGTKVGGTTNDPIYDTGVFICTGAASAGRLTVPASVLNQLPATPADALTTGSGIGILLVLSNTVPSASSGLFTAPLTAGGNIDMGVFIATVGNMTTTLYQ